MLDNFSPAFGRINKNMTRGRILDSSKKPIIKKVLEDVKTRQLNRLIQDEYVPVSKPRQSMPLPQADSDGFVHIQNGPSKTLKRTPSL